MALIENVVMVSTTDRNGRRDAAPLPPSQYGLRDKTVGLQAQAVLYEPPSFPRQIRVSLAKKRRRYELVTWTFRRGWRRSPPPIQYRNVGFPISAIYNQSQT